MEQITLTEKRFFEWHEDNVSVTLRNSPVRMGGSEVFVISYTKIPLERYKRLTTKEPEVSMSKRTS